MTDYHFLFFVIILNSCSSISWLVHGIDDVGSAHPTIESIFAFFYFLVGSRLDDVGYDLSRSI
jgi:hypothetical protein